MRPKIVLYNPRAVFNTMPLALLAVGSALDGERYEVVIVDGRLESRELRAMSSDFELALFYFKPYPGNPIADELRAQGYRFPATLEEWAEFDYIGRANDWLTEAQQREIEHFTFYQRLAYSGDRGLARRPLRRLSGWRVERGVYALPIDRRLIEWLRPAQALS